MISTPRALVSCILAVGSMQSAMFYVVLSCLMISATRDTITGLSHGSWLVVRSVGLAWFVRRVRDELASSGMGVP